MDASRKRAYAQLAAILLVAAALQTLLLARLPTISADGIIFIGLARELAADPIGTFRTQDQHPGFPAMLLAATRAAQMLGYQAEPQSWVFGAMAVSFVCGLASVAVVWLLARDLFDEKIAAVAALVFAFLPVPRTNAVDAQSDTAHALFYLLAAWLATTGMTSGNFWRLAAAGLASGAAYWIRPEGLEVAIVAVPILAWHGWRAGWSWKRLTLATGAVAVAALVVAAPYMVLSGKITSKQLQFAKVTPAPTYLEQLAAAPSSPQAPSEEQAATGPADIAPADIAPAATTPVTDAPAPAPPAPRYSLKLVVSVVGAALAAFINSICQGFKFVCIPFYFCGLSALRWRSPPRVQVAFLAILGVTHVLILMGVYVVSGYIAHRHTIPLVGLAMPFVALGFFQCGAWATRWVPARAGVCTAVLLVGAIATVLPYTLRHLNREFVPVIEASRWVQARAPQGTGVVCNSPYVSFYSALPVAELGPTAGTLGEALAKAPAGAHYDYVVLHVGAHAYQPRWIDELAPAYHQVLELPDHLSGDKPRKVLVFESRHATPRNASRPTQ